MSCPECLRKGYKRLCMWLRDVLGTATGVRLQMLLELGESMSFWDVVRHLTSLPFSGACGPESRRLVTVAKEVPNFRYRYRLLGCSDPGFKHVSTPSHLSLLRPTRSQRSVMKNKDPKSRSRRNASFYIKKKTPNILSTGISLVFCGY